MRDIRQELEERVRSLELQMGGTDAWFEQRVEQLKKEIEQLKQDRASKIAELKRELQLVDRVLHFEQQRFGPAMQSGHSAIASGGEVRANPNGPAVQPPH